MTYIYSSTIRPSLSGFEHEGARVGIRNASTEGLWALFSGRPPCHQYRGKDIIRNSTGVTEKLPQGDLIRCFDGGQVWAGSITVARR